MEEQQTTAADNGQMELENEDSAENNDSEDEDSDNERDLEKEVQAYVPGAVKHLCKDPQFITHMDNIRKLLDKPENTEEVKRKINIEDDPEYAFIIKTNSIIQNISEEIMALHHAVVEIYNTKFPDLHTLVPNALDYLKLVKRMGNETDMNQVQMDDILPKSQIMAVTLTGSAIDGNPLSPSQLSQIDGFIEEAFQLDQDRSLLLRFIESRMQWMAPNVSALVGTHIAARVIGQVGGLQALAAMPACNVLLVGQAKQVAESYGLSARRHTGIIYQSDIVQQAPDALRPKICRVLANKLTLAARIDAQGAKDGLAGEKYRHFVQEKLEKLLEPSAGMREKPLPVPGDAPKKRRGGRRVRKMKEARAMTDMQKRMNRRAFGVAAENYADDAMGLDLGMLATGGELRRAVAKKMKLSQKTIKKLGQMANKGAVSGLASSFNIADAQGIQLISTAQQLANKAKK